MYLVHLCFLALHSNFIAAFVSTSLRRPVRRTQTIWWSRACVLAISRLVHCLFYLVQIALSKEDFIMPPDSRPPTAQRSDGEVTPSQTHPVTTASVVDKALPPPQKASSWKITTALIQNLVSRLLLSSEIRRANRYAGILLITFYNKL